MRMFILVLIFGNDIEAISGFTTKHECERTASLIKQFQVHRELSEVKTLCLPGQWR